MKKYKKFTNKHNYIINIENIFVSCNFKGCSFKFSYGTTYYFYNCVFDNCLLDGFPSANVVFNNCTFWNNNRINYSLLSAVNVTFHTPIYLDNNTIIYNNNDNIVTFTIRCCDELKNIAFDKGVVLITDDKNILVGVGNILYPYSEVPQKIKDLKSFVNGKHKILIKRNILLFETLLKFIKLNYKHLL